ncbi:MAG: Sua5/YciO/YrdC/YwlC family protein [Candidatus Omnitrophica bacterium]|nr:Sua5/YciO/YrdC/YwlC family protein [Candidatus Omnitrophota bacterium]MCM8828505.1 Sua5/YciO/YrdC/YwlC family protein [Candidatus Omnitrophota bacterium]
MTTILRLNPDSEIEILEKTADILKKSGVAIVPTDTVYGLVCDGESEYAKKNIYLIKKRTESKPLIGFVRNIEQAERVAFIPRLFLPFILNRWPGRNTFVFRSRIESRYIVNKDHTIALRIPAHNFINLLCEIFPFLASTSANISSYGSACCVAQIDSSVVNNVSITIDNGKLPGRESAIWDMTQDTPKLIRGKVLFVCSGNSCRSPMAQAILKSFVATSIDVISAGIEPNFYGSMTRESIEVLKETGINVQNFVSKNLTREMLEFSDLVFVMEEKHRERVLQLFPQAYDRVFVLNVQDPAGSDIFKYRQIRDIIKQRIIKNVLTRIKT